MIWKVVIVIAAAVASYFIPTAQELRNAFSAGQNFYASSNFQRAIEQYDIIIKTDSEFLSEDSVRVELFSGEMVVSVVVAAYYQKANAIKSLGDNTKAIEIFRIVENRQDEKQLAALAQFQIYDIFYRTEVYDSAIVEARKLVEKYPKDTKAEAALFDIAWAYRELENLEQSNSAFFELVEKYPETSFYPRALFQIGQNYYDQKQYDSSIVYWKLLNEKFRPTAFKEQDWENIQLRSVKDRQIFEATAGRDTDESALELVAKGQVKIGDAYRQKNEFENAMEHYRSVTTTFTLLPLLIEVTYVKMADYTIQELGLEEGIGVYRRAIDENFANKEIQAKMQYMIAETYQNREMFAKAGDEFIFYINAYSDVAQSIEFDVDKALYSATAMFYNAGNFEKAVSTADTLINTYPFSDVAAGTLFLKGISLNALNRFTEARTSFQRIVDNFKNSPDYGNARVQIGFTYYQEENYETALDYYLAVLNEGLTEIDSSQVYFDLISIYSELKRYDEALAAFNNIRFGSTYYAPAFGKVAKVYATRSEFEQGENFLNEILEKSKNNEEVYYTPDVYFALADLNITKNDFRTAVNYLAKVIEDTVADQSKDILKLQSRYARGILNYQIDNYSGAITDLELILNDNNFQDRFGGFVPNATEKLALSYSKIGRSAEALEMIAAYHENADTPEEKAKWDYAIVNIHYESGNYRKAIETAELLLGVEGLDDEILLNSIIITSESYQKLGDLNKAAAVLLEASEKYPDSPDIPIVLYSLGALYFDARDYEQSADIFNKFITRYPDHSSVKEARYFRGYAYYESGMWQQAYNSFKQYVAAYPEDPAAAETQYYASEALFNNKNFESAIREYRIVYQRFPRSDYAPMAMYAEGWCYFEMEKFEDMVTVFRQLSTRFPNSSYAGDALFTVGDYYYNQKDYPNASIAYTELIEKFPSYERIEEARTLVYDLSQINSYLEYEEAMKFFDARDYKQAIVELKKVLEKYPDESIAVGCRVNIAASYEMIDDFRNAAEWYKIVIEKYDGSSDDNERSAVFFAKEHLEWVLSQI